MMKRTILSIDEDRDGQVSVSLGYGIGRGNILEVMRKVQTLLGTAEEMTDEELDAAYDLLGTATACLLGLRMNEKQIDGDLAELGSLAKAAHRAYTRRTEELLAGQHDKGRNQGVVS